MLPVFQKNPKFFSCQLKLTLLCLATTYAFPANANVSGSDHQNFNPAPGRYDFLSVVSPRTQKKGYLHLGLYLNTAVNTLPYGGEENSRDTAQDLNDTLTGLDLQISHGLHDLWEVSFSIPYMVHQTIKDKEEFHGEFKKLGNTELRLQNKFSLFSNSYSSYGLLATVNYNRVINNPYSGTNNWTAFGLDLLGEWRWSSIRFGSNLGYRWRPKSDSIFFDNKLISDVLRDQWLASMAMGILIPDTKLELVTEIYSSKVIGSVSSVSGREAFPLESMVALKWDLPRNYRFNFGYARELRHAISSADHRFFVGLTWLTPLRPLKWRDDSSSSEVIARKNKMKIPPHHIKAFSENRKITPSRQAHQPVNSLGMLTRSHGGGVDPQVGGLAMEARSPDRIIRLSNVLFAFDSDKLNGMKAYEDIARVAGILAEADLDYVEVAGHTCSLGDSMYNLDLSERRTQTIVKVLVERYGIPREKIIPVGYGEMFPLTSNEAETLRSLNRRVEFRVFFRNQSNKENMASINF